MDNLNAIVLRNMHHVSTISIQMIKVDYYIFRLSLFQFILCFSHAHYKTVLPVFKSHARDEQSYLSY